MTTGGRQEFAWVDQENAPHEPYDGKGFVPNPTWRARWRDENPYGTTIRVIHRNKGLYDVIVTDHEPFDAYQAQVVAYGADNARCKFHRRPIPEYIGTWDGTDWWGSRMFVSCLKGTGGAVDSKFVFSFSAWPRDEDSAIVGPLDGPAAFFETTTGVTRIPGTDIARSYEYIGTSRPPTFRTGSRYMSFNSSSGNPLPRIRRTSTGVYKVSIPGLGTPNPGLAQVTALGSDVTHCQATTPVASATGETLEVTVYGWAGATLEDTNFILNYDQTVTRISPYHQGARAYANKPSAASYTPARSYNSGAFMDSAGTNTAYRIETGRYRMHHSDISATPNSVWVAAAPSFSLGHYCKVECWNPSGPSAAGLPGTDVYIRCFDAQGNRVDSPYFETFQGIPIGPT
ncbi:hypothetical protein ACWF9G_22855 [Nocardia sp. NPDC055029]